MRRFVLAGVALAALFIGGCSGEASDLATTTDTDTIVESSTTFESVQATCYLPAAVLADENRTLILDLVGDDPGSGITGTDALPCVLVALDTPQSVIARMEHTRALDGVQDATWGTYSATWSYHPDTGFDLIVTDDS